MPELTSIMEFVSKKPKVEVYVGVNGLKSIFEDILRSNVKEYFAIGSPGFGPKILPYYLPGFYKRKAKLKINLKMIFSNTKESRERAEKLKEYRLIEVRYISKKYTTPLSVYVYGNKTALLTWSKLEPLAFRIDCKYVTEGFRNYILALWETAKKK